MPIEFSQEMQQEQRAQYRIPYDTRPMEGDLRPSQKIALHGGIVIVNATTLFVHVHEEFRLQHGGYYVSIIDTDTGNLLLTMQSPMNSAYLLHKAEYGYDLALLDVEEPN
jgi:hypothetical protein